MECIYETERLRVRKLVMGDLISFDKMQGNINVMRFVKPVILNYEENKADLIRLIDLYTKPDNDFFIYAIERKYDAAFIGSVALLKNGSDDEIGYRFLEKYWRMGYGGEVVKGLIDYCKQNNFKKLIAYVSIENCASEKIIKKVGFQFIEDTLCEELQILEKKYRLEL